MIKITLKEVINFFAILITCAIMWVLGFVAGQAHPQYRIFDFGMKNPVIGAPVVPAAPGKTTPK